MKRRDIRRPGPGPYLLGLERNPDVGWGDGFPYGGVKLHEQSHGESFLALASNRFAGEGLYILDEPEAALSVSGALAVLAAITRAARAHAQFIVATHSPILLACPGARIYELDEDGFSDCAYDELDVVRLYRDFLSDPERYLRAVLD